MNRLADTAAQSVAVLQLKLVDSVIGAIGAADANSWATRVGGNDSALSPVQPRPRLHLAAVYEPSKHRSPSPVYHPGRHRDVSAWRHPCVPVCDLDPIKPSVPDATKHRIEPPWDCLRWPQPLPLRQPVKKYAHRTDVTANGAILDIFL